MTVRRSFALILAAPLLLLAQLLNAAETVRVEGLVANPGEFQWQAGARLLQATIAADVDSQAWYMGAMLQRESAKAEQVKLKVGVLFDLESALVNARGQSSTEIAELLGKLMEDTRKLPVTGRIRAELNPLKLRLASSNPLLQAGDRLIYPARPQHVQILGAVQQNCRLAFVADHSPADYLRDCPRHAAADPDYIYLIQPDGLVSRLGIAAWNRRSAWVAVGATIYVPLRPALFASSDNGFNDDMAALLATQPLSGGHAGE